jgi:hypothetical protein
MAIAAAIERSLNPFHVPYLQHILNHAIYGIKDMLRNINPIGINVLRNSFHQNLASGSTTTSLNVRLMLRQRDDPDARERTSIPADIRAGTMIKTAAVGEFSGSPT